MILDGTAHYPELDR